MKQPYLLQTSPDSLILFDNGKDNFLADFHQAFSGCEVESEHENIFALFGTDAFFTVRGGQPALQDWDGKIYFSLPLPFPLDLAGGCGVMPVGTPETVAAERLQARFADKTTMPACRRPLLILPLKTVGNHTIVRRCASACSTNRSKSV